MWQTHRHWGASPPAQTRRIGLPSSPCGGGGWGWGGSRRRAAMSSAVRRGRAVPVAARLSAVCSQRDGLHDLTHTHKHQHITHCFHPASWASFDLWFCLVGMSHIGQYVDTEIMLCITKIDISSEKTLVKGTFTREWLTKNGKVFLFFFSHIDDNVFKSISVHTDQCIPLCKETLWALF